MKPEVSFPLQISKGGAVVRIFRQVGPAKGRGAIRGYRFRVNYYFTSRLRG
jgi:hypothetical protein